MKIGIVGGGSVGLLVSSYLCEHHDITLYVRRKEQKEQINKIGIQIDDQIIHKQTKALLLAELKTEDCLIICVKQPELLDVLQFIKDNSDTPIIFLQNGMGHLELIQSMSQPLFVGVVEHGARRMNDHKVNHTGKGNIKIASLTGTDGQLNKLTELLHHPNFPIEKARNWHRLLAEKLVINAVINPLTALFQVENGYILDNHYLKNIAKKLCEEAVQVLGLKFSEQWAHVKDIARKTGRNRSSMLSDIEKGRPTEIEAITGYLVNLTTADMPYTTFVYQSVKVIEMQKGIRK